MRRLNFPGVLATVIALSSFALPQAAPVGSTTKTDTAQGSLTEGITVQKNQVLNRLPAGARVRSVQEARAAYLSLTDEQKQAILSRFNSLGDEEKRALIAKVRPYFKQAFDKARKEHIASLANQDLQVHVRDLEGAILRGTAPQSPLNNGVLIVDSQGKLVTVAPGDLSSASSTTGEPWWDKVRPLGEAFKSPGLVSPSPMDDADGLPEAFESSLADDFTFGYFVSKGEPDLFATFLNQVPTVVNQTQPNPLSYYRVQPLGFINDATGRQFGAIRIDYLTLWNQDSGLVVDDFCTAELSLVAGLVGFSSSVILNGVSGHPLDDEHAATLVVAATPSPNTYNLDHTQYQVINYYTAAHEGLPFVDHSLYFTVLEVLPNGNLIYPPAPFNMSVGLSLSKHSTYPYNPDGDPILQEWVIATYFATIDDLYFSNIIDQGTYLFLQAVGGSVFFGCIIEHFQDQGGVFASPRIDVGEPILGQVENNAGFILDPNHVLPKLNETIWTLRNGAPDFSLTASPSSQTTNQGDGTGYGVKVLPLSGFSNSVNLSISGLPSGVTASFNPTTIVPGSSNASSSQLSVSTSKSTPAGTYTLTIFGTGGGITHTASVTLTVKGTPDFVLLPNPAIQAIPAGQSTTYKISTGILSGFNGTVNLSLSGLPSNTTGSFNPASINGSGSSTLTVTTTASTPVGPYTLTVTGTSGNLTHTTIVTLKVGQFFSLSASPATQTVTAGGSTSYTAALISQGGFNGTVGLSVSGLPTGATASFNPTSVSGSGSSTLTVATTASTPGGTYMLTITGTSGSIAQNTAVTLKVSNFSISAAPVIQTVTAGGRTTYTATVAALNGFTGTVTLSANVSGSPAGVAASFNPATVSGSASSTLTLSTTSFTPSGTYAVTITGVSGSLSHNTTVTLNVTNNYGTGSVAITGTEQFITICYYLRCHKLYDHGTVSVTVNGFTQTVSYFASSTDPTIASALANAFNSASGSPVTAATVGSTLYLISKVSGSGGNYALSATSKTSDPYDFGGPSFTPVPSGPTLTGGH